MNHSIFFYFFMGIIWQRSMCLLSLYFLRNYRNVLYLFHAFSEHTSLTTRSTHSFCLDQAISSVPGWAFKPRGFNRFLVIKVYKAQLLHVLNIFHVFFSSWFLRLLRNVRCSFSNRQVLNDILRCASKIFLRCLYHSTLITEDHLWAKRWHRCAKQRVRRRIISRRFLFEGFITWIRFQNLFHMFLCL